jgi:hypothetical protein
MYTKHEFQLDIQGYYKFIWVIKKVVYFRNSYKHETTWKQQENSLSFC